jgi:hypothetical protein
MTRGHSRRRWWRSARGRVAAALGTLLLSAGPVGAETVAVSLQLTASASVSAGVVPGRDYRFVYTGAVAGSLAGEFAHALAIHPETVWWTAAEVPWDTLLITTPRGTVTLSLAAARLIRNEASDSAPWAGTGTWTVGGGTGIFSGASGSGTLALTALTNPTVTNNPLTETLTGTLTLDSAAPAVKLTRGTSRTPLRGPNGRLALRIEVTEPNPSSGLRRIELQGTNAVVVQVNSDPAAAVLPYRREFLEGTGVKKWTVLLESLDATLPPEATVTLVDWAGNTVMK